jgi:outer membrane receptor protein involved in Fe transport
VIRVRVSRLVVAIAVWRSSALVAQQPARVDSSTRQLDTIVVTAERSHAGIATTAASVTRLSGEQLARLPVRTVGDALQYVPGFVVIYGDATGNAPRVIARGFYGGAETEYVAVLIDGVPTSEVAGGAVNWDLVPLSSIAAIEVVRGGTSSLYGDAAIGGVINLITRGAGEPDVQWRASVGAFGAAQAAGRIRVGRATVFGDVAQTEGYRTHEARRTASVGGSLDLISAADRSLTFGILDHSRRFEDPGALSESALAADRRASSPFSLFDVTRQNVHRITLDGSQTIGAARLTGYTAAEIAGSNAILTLPLSASFADTKSRAIDSWRTLGSVQAEVDRELWGWMHRFVVGTDASVGGLTSTYQPLVSGPASAYTGSPSVGAAETRGSGRRDAAAGFAEWQVLPREPLRIDVGMRYDEISDRYSPSIPTGEPTLHESRGAWSPRLGVNLRYADGGLGTGNLFLSANGAFKAPTMDQLYDQRRIPVPFPPYGVTLSNSQLQPQTLRGMEAGFYHRAPLLDGRADASLTMSAYQMDMRQELDFDLQQFKYVNIGRSRHRGVEGSLSASGPFGMNAFANLTAQSAVSRAGDSNGRELRGIPRQAWTLGVGRAAQNGLSTTLSATVVGRSFLDDDNTSTIPGYTRFDLRAAAPIKVARLTVEVRNLFDRRYDYTGYPDPGGSAVRFFYPAAGRAVLVGIASR